MSRLLTLPNELLLLIADFVLQRPPCLCHHPSRHLSVFSRCNRLLHTILTPHLLRSVSAVSILLWAIHHIRHDTAVLALQQGADPNALIIKLRRNVNSKYIGTPVHLATRMLTRSPDASVHNVKFRILTLLIRAGGKQSIKTISIAARRGDLDVLELSLPHFAHLAVFIKEMLNDAVRRGNFQVLAMLLATGIRGGSVGGRYHPQYYPSLWTLCTAGPRVVQMLLDAGADPLWEDNGVSIAEHLLSYEDTADSDITLELLRRYGARMPKDITLRQAPVWESWTALGESEPVEEQVRVDQNVMGHNEYRGWVPGIKGNEWGWMSRSVCALQSVACECPECPSRANSTYRMVMFTVE